MSIPSSLRVIVLPLLCIAGGTALLLNPQGMSHAADIVGVSAAVLIAGSLVNAALAWRGGQRAARTRRLAWAALMGAFGLLLALRLNSAPVLTLFLLAVFLLIVGFLRLALTAWDARAMRRIPRARHV